MSRDENGEEKQTNHELSKSKVEVSANTRLHDKRVSESIRQQTGLIEQIYVHDVYERIAHDFESSDYHLWPYVKKYLCGLPPGSLVADIGCGNGQYMNVSRNITVIGIDRSSNLLQSAQIKNPGLIIRADGVNLPLLSSLFDSVICVGVLHHLVSSQRQISLLKEISRILRTSGTAVLYVWAYEQSKRKIDGQDLLVPRQFTDNYLPLHDLHIPSRPANSSFLIKLQLLFGMRKSESGAETCQNCSTARKIPAEFQVREFPASSLFISRRSKEESVSLPCQHVMSGSCKMNSLVYSKLAPNVVERGRDERYYHMFKHDELVKLITQHVPQLQIQHTKLDNGHWCFILIKTSTQTQTCQNSSDKQNCQM